jgi:hypothetical protein
MPDRRDGDDTSIIWDTATGRRVKGEDLPAVLLDGPISPDSRLRVEIDPSDRTLILLTLVGSGTPGYDPWAEDAEHRRVMAPKWHAKDAAAAEQAGIWFAAEFHLQRLIQLSPDDETLPPRLEHARAQQNAAQPADGPTTSPPSPPESSND